MSTIPLPHAAIVQSIQAEQPFQPGDILLIQSATTQANIPVLVLGVSRLDSAAFTVDTSTDPDTIKLASSTPGGGTQDINTQGSIQVVDAVGVPISALSDNGFIYSKLGFAINGTPGIVINDGGTFVGPGGINTSGSIVLRGGGVFIQDAAATGNNAVIQPDGAFAIDRLLSKDFVQWIDSNGRFLGPGGIVTTGVIVLQGNNLLIRNAAGDTDMIQMFADGNIRALGAIQVKDGVFVKNAAGTPLGYIDAAGAMISVGYYIGGTPVIDAGSTFIGPGGVNTSGIIVAHGGGYLEIQNPSGTVVATIGSDGIVSAAGYSVYGSSQYGTIGTFTSQDGKTVTVNHGLVTSIV